MNVPDRKTQLLNELCSNGHLEKHRKVLSKILNEIHDSNCKISCRYDKIGSNIEQHREEGYPHIRISLVAVEEPLNIIWAILHEFGHYKSGKPNGETKMEREIIAWDIAENSLKQYLELLVDFDSFQRHKDYCLSSYIKSFHL